MHFQKPNLADSRPYTVSVFTIILRSYIIFLNGEETLNNVLFEASSEDTTLLITTYKLIIE